MRIVYTICPLRNVSYSDEETRAEMYINQNGGLRPMGVLKLIDTVMDTLERHGDL